MRYLNKIVFINSAAIPYSEILLDGNVHFIGTQGVGKSTVLRAILYFYNADSRRLGVPTGPTNKPFADWYFRWANSFIVYEVVRETGPFCVLAYKSQNKVCHRFIDSGYQRSYFLNDRGEAFSQWEQIRAALDAARIHYTPKITSYDQYRDILYGNHSGRGEYRKFALLEAREYKNIYRTIQNVFLNTKLDAIDIKQTIISSMADEDVTIDLDQYAHHLKDFEVQLDDIRRFHYPSVSRHAEQAGLMLAATRHLERENKQLGLQLSARIHFNGQKLPLLEQEHTKLNVRREEVSAALSRERQLFAKRKENFTKEINVLEGLLKQSARQKAYHQRQNIEMLIERVARKQDLEKEKDHLRQEQQVLKSDFADVVHQYEVLINGYQNNFKSFENQKKDDILALKDQELQARREVEDYYAGLLEETASQFQLKIRETEKSAEEKKGEIHRLEKKKAEMKHKRLFEKEQSEQQEALKDLKVNFAKAKNNLDHYQAQIDSLETKWNLEKQHAEAENGRKKKELETVLAILKKECDDLKYKIETSKETLFGWLKENKPGWEATIGQVIDEGILFSTDLSPQAVAGNLSFYGISVNLKEIDRPVPSIEDYQYVLKGKEQEVESLRKEANDLAGGLDKELDKIQNRNLPKIREYKKSLRGETYNVEQLERKIKQSELHFKDILKKAAEEKERILSALNLEVDVLCLRLTQLEEALRELHQELDRKIAAHKRERTRRINLLAEETTASVGQVQAQIQQKKQQTDHQIAEVNKRKKGELDKMGADTFRLSAIEKRLAEVESELVFIDEHRAKVSDYYKDKRELFDREKEFKNDLQQLKMKLEQLTLDYETLIKSFSDQHRLIETDLSEVNEKIRVIQTDHKKFEDDFLKSEIFSCMRPLPEGNHPEGETCRPAVELIEEIKTNLYERKDRENDLKENIDKFLGHFSENNLFRFPVKLITTDEYLGFSEVLEDFIEEEKIQEFEKRVNERFSTIINSVGKETSTLISRIGEIQKVVSRINNDFQKKNFVGAIKKIALNVADSKNSVVVLLKMIKEFNDNHNLTLGEVNLFSSAQQDKNNERATDLLKHLVKEIKVAKDSTIQLSDSFELTFRVEENENDTGWVEKLSNVGSDGTDVLVKAMVNIMLLNVFKEKDSRRFREFKLHCMMDEVGKLHPENVKGILKFANDRNILLINGSPTTNTPLDYRHIYKLKKEQNDTMVRRIVSSVAVVAENQT